MTVRITDQTMKLMGMGLVSKENTGRINSLDFHREADQLITGSDDDSIRMYNTATGDLMETLFSKKYGVSNISMLHASSCALYATNKAPSGHQDQYWYSLRYHDLQRNEYIRYFRGHTAPVNTLTTSPKTDLFMSTSLDKTMRLWDIRTNICQGSMTVSGVPCASFDQQGLVFAVATESGVIKLYDVRSYDKGPFDTFTVQEELNTPSVFTDLRFSNDGKFILGVVENKVHVLDAFNGNKVHMFSTGNTEGNPSMEAAFSPDTRYVLSGCQDKSITVWSIETGEEVAKLSGHVGVPRCLKFAPRRCLLAGACQALILWIPPLGAFEDSMQTQ
mmetsp:Transcript_18089/g.30986  ORF Transcript_18089/g.30986 Transcript_18089/m.30986 type:complete len:332 (-) Transcript_18089:377-1372(-)|eukprot:CAMPEP_0119110280 /NCGR_PEP_ID=MMETSP1180-20130426/28423_1 /TAXON_ID=3052 ORGANISM="Chlamydomonas cf sp, Strain CCMP681" /NCGR_SAMPLE_ID=MMETSP1180 /ASSEMBLY_ACC=CAM_ASM_000741 /LENGTH=331 /DNA_ID=CAMNT_0007096521 /DNA_START=233 /DNA_END=1228 /DNA_ORIENTATION=-